MNYDMLHYDMLDATFLLFSIKTWFFIECIEKCNNLENSELVFCVVPLCFFTFWVPFRHTNYGRLSYLRYLCLFTYGGVQRILCCVFLLMCVVLCTLCYKLLWIVNIWLAPSVFFKSLFYSKYVNRVVGFFFRSASNCKQWLEKWQMVCCKWITG